MKNWLVASLAFIACVSGAFAAPVPQVLADGQSMVVGGQDSDCAVSQCVRIERGGDMVYHYAIVKGKVIKVLAFELPLDARLVPTPQYVKTGSGDYRVQDFPPAPGPPPGGTGTVIMSQTYITATDIVVVTVIFFYQNNQLIGVQTNEVTQPRYKKPL